MREQLQRSHPGPATLQNCRSLTPHLPSAPPKPATIRARNPTGGAPDVRLWKRKLAAACGAFPSLFPPNPQAVRNLPNPPPFPAHDGCSGRDLPHHRHPRRRNPFFPDPNVRSRPPWHPLAEPALHWSPVGAAAFFRPAGEHVSPQSRCVPRRFLCPPSAEEPPFARHSFVPASPSYSRAIRLYDDHPEAPPFRLRASHLQSSTWATLVIGGPSLADIPCPRRPWTAHEERAPVRPRDPRPPALRSVRATRPT